MGYLIPSENRMNDLVFIAVLVGCLLATGVLIAGCERLMPRDGGSKP